MRKAAANSSCELAGRSVKSWSMKSLGLEDAVLAVPEPDIERSVRRVVVGLDAMLERDDPVTLHGMGHARELRRIRLDLEFVEIGAEGRAAEEQLRRRWREGPQRGQGIVGLQVLNEV